MESSLSSELMDEFIGWYGNLVLQGEFPKGTTGVNAQGQQFVFTFRDLPLDHAETLDFLHHIFAIEKVIAFAFGLRMGVLIDESNGESEERIDLFSGGSGRYEFAELRQKLKGSWEEGAELDDRSSSATPIHFFQELLEPAKLNEKSIAKFDSLWTSIRDRIMWRQR